MTFWSSASGRFSQTLRDPMPNDAGEIWRRGIGCEEMQRIRHHYLSFKHDFATYDSRVTVTNNGSEKDSGVGWTGAHLGENKHPEHEVIMGVRIDSIRRHVYTSRQ